MRCSPPPAREIFDVLDMSRHAPFVDAAVSVDPVNTANTFISYYTYGQALALGIDLSIRSRFPGKTLDDWMRQMWREHPDSDQPYTVEDLERTLGEATTPEFARDIFRRHIYGKEPMDYRALLALAGFTLEAKETPPKVWIGASLALGDRGADILDATPRGAPIYAAGLDRGDRILEWDGHPSRPRPSSKRCWNGTSPATRFTCALSAAASTKKPTWCWPPRPPRP